MTDDLKIYNPRKFENLVKVFFNPSSVQFHQSQNTFIKVSEKVMNHCIWCMTYVINWPELVNQECNLGTSMWKWQTPAWWSDSLLLILHCMLFVVPYFHWTKDDELANAPYIGICLIQWVPQLFEQFLHVNKLCKIECCGNKMRKIVQNMILTWGLELKPNLLRRATLSGQHSLFYRWEKAGVPLLPSKYNGRRGSSTFSHL